MLTNDRIIAWREKKPVLFHEFQSRVNAWYSLLQRTPGQKFALHLNDSVEFVSALYGCWQAKKMIYLPSNTLPETCVALQKMTDGFLGEFSPLYSPLNPNDDDEQSACSVSEKTMDDYMGLVIYTSGSSGEPQAIPKYLSQLFREVETLEKTFGRRFNPNTEIVATVSHEHLYGLLFKILWPLQTGRSFHVRSAVFLEEYAELFSTRDCVLVSSPAHLKRITSTHKLHAVFSSASPLSLETAHKTQQLLGVIPLEIYGSTETGGIAWRTHDQPWQPLPGITIRATEHKTLKISSPHLHNLDWFTTTDKVEIVNHGFVLQGRTDRIIKLEGKRISLDLIEHTLKQSSLVLNARAVMSDENNQRQYIMAFIVLSSEGHAFLEKNNKISLNKHLRETLRNSVERIALPRVFHYLNELPLNPQGKTTRTELLPPTMPHQKLIEQSDQRALLELTPPPELLYFKGHFPQTPILPGVVQVHWAIHYGIQCFNVSKHFRGIQKLKFQKIIQPNTTLTLELCYDEKKSVLNFRYYSQLGQHSSGSILC